MKSMTVVQPKALLARRKPGGAEACEHIRFGDGQTLQVQIDDTVYGATLP